MFSFDIPQTYRRDARRKRKRKRKREGGGGGGGGGERARVRSHVSEEYMGGGGVNEGVTANV